jgi:sterol desaturase/sphingolipid hydroxylase (fatty acid hydroxylase superfamily)
MTIKRALIQAMIGILSAGIASTWFGQTPGTVGLFESLAFTAKSLHGVEYWGPPIYELVYLFIVVFCSVEFAVGCVRRDFSAFAPMLIGWLRHIGYLGVWVLLFTIVANNNQGNGLPKLLTFDLTQRWEGLLVLFVIVDAMYYLEHRTLHRVLAISKVQRPRWRRNRPGESGNAKVGRRALRRDTSADGLSVGLLEPFWTLAFLSPLAILGFDLLWLVAMRMVLSLHHAILLFRFLPGASRLGILVVTPASKRSHQESPDTNFGAVLGIWDHLFGTAKRRERTAQVTDGFTGYGKQND